MKNKTVNSNVQKSATPHMYCNFKTSKWVKLGTLFLENVNLNSKLYFNREEKFKNKNAKRSKEEPRKNQ